VDYTRGSLELKINTQTASVKGTYHFEIEGEKPGQAVTLACTGSLDNYGKPGTDKRDYFEVKRTATCTIGYIRTSKDMVSRNVGYISLVVRGPSDHDAPGYEYANFRCQ
jgi:hypothetical protein